MTSNDTSLMAHLLRRAGFGANRDELERYLAMGYDGAVETLLHPTDPDNMPDDLIRRYHVEQSELRDLINELRSLTLGVGTFTYQFDHLQELAGRQAEQIIEQRNQRQTAAAG